MKIWTTIKGGLGVLLLTLLCIQIGLGDAEEEGGGI